MSFCYTLVFSFWCIDLHSFSGGGGWISIWNQGKEAQKIWNLGIEAQKIWNLGSEKISGIWDLVVLDYFFWQNKFSQQLYVPNINKHKSILQMDPQTETVRPNTLVITGAWWYNHNHNAPKYTRTFQGSHQISEGIFKWPQIEPHGTMWLCDPLNHYFHFWPITNTVRFNNLVQSVFNKRGAGWGGSRIRYSIKKIVLIRDSISEISP